MAFQRSYARLQASPHWKTLEEFSLDGTRLELQFPLSVTSTVREDIRQICKYLNLNFRCIGQGSQKRIYALKMDAIRERKRAEELCETAPPVVAAYFRGVRELIPADQRIRVTALFVQHYGGEKAWSLGEQRITLEEAEERASGGASQPPAAKRRRGEDAAGEGAAEEAPAEATAEAEAEGSDSEDLEALLGKWQAVPGA
eukprot:TRINITY_DN28833_c0_g1_i1.p1 TRINITY_DN28833_c0_g1~~TRINITY_DN28833_c0_g1_i1.p1  ORF type:complete len:219 (-),score=70.22 TRINITY_DN28833_c0_g1_i1:362-961(-)